MIDNAWAIRTWTRTHRTHGVFVVTVQQDGTASATRVHGPANTLDNLSPAEPFENVGMALVACELRIVELDRLIVAETVADLRAYAERAAS